MRHTITASVPEWVYASLLAEANEDGQTLEEFVTDVLTGTAAGNIAVRAGVVEERIEALGLSDAEMHRLNDYLMIIMGLDPDD